MGCPTTNNQMDSPLVGHTTHNSITRSRHKWFVGMASSGSAKHFEIQRRREAIPSQWEARMLVLQEARVRFEEAISQTTIIRETTKIDLPKPKEFKGVRDAR
ncbi:hypothetical protein PIB30_057201 [Stylosanthes scabra]|uniref:Uncharacterized protein n=1 Tax=Stylosanthes scabra TaxID=79078 RepID=A0ABU6VJU9_9FABA|nr:hypothetical protein [Stylosanthes scabra]